MSLIKTIAPFLLLAAAVDAAAASVVRQADVVVARGENDPLDAPWTGESGERPPP
jgi:hypothetical protein